MAFSSPPADAPPGHVGVCSCVVWLCVRQAFYFGSRPEGLQDEATLSLIANYSLAGWGWEQGLGPRCVGCNSWHPTGALDTLHFCGSEQRLSETATRFRSYLQWGPPSRDPRQPDAATKPLFVYHGRDQAERSLQLL